MSLGSLSSSLSSAITSSPGISSAVGLIGGELSTLLLTQGRSIGPTTGDGTTIKAIIPNVTISEHHQDRLAITNHPVEYGAAITDHSYAMPAEVTCEYGWSPNAGSLTQQLEADIQALTGNGVTPQQVYQQLLALQQSRQPFNLITGKRPYTNMLLEGLEVTTDRKSENILSVKATFRQIIIVNTQSVTMAAASQQSDPSSTSPIQNTGVQQPVPVPASQGQTILKSLFG